MPLAALNPPGHAVGPVPSASEFYRWRSADLGSLPRLQGHASGRGRTCIWVCDFSAAHSQRRELVGVCCSRGICNASIMVGATRWEELVAEQPTQHSSCLPLRGGRPQASQASLLDWHYHPSLQGPVCRWSPSSQPCLSPLSSLACLCWTPWMDLLSGLLPGSEAVLGPKFCFC